MIVRSPASFEFTPTNVPPELLDARTVGRSELLERIEARIRNAATGGGKAHTLVVGARGSGKTHLLTVAAHRAASADDLAERLSIISLAEDAEGVVSYADLLFTVIERGLNAGAMASVVDPGDTLASARKSRRDSDALERLVRESAGPRIVMLVIENLDRIFADIGIDGQRRFRAFVENWRRTVILASTPLLFSAVSDREEPWYGSFIPEHLDDVGVDEGTQILIGLARERGDDELATFLAGELAAERLRAVADIAGGSPRMWVMLHGCLSAELLDDLLPLMERLLENLVPYYQARLLELPGNERKLVIELARTSVVEHDGAVAYRSQGARAVSDLAEACGIDRNVASSSLRRLAAARWVRTLPMPGTDGRTSWYELREPLLRHHLQHRETGGGTLAVIVSLLKAWHSLPARISLLGAARKGSVAERHLLASVDAPTPSDAGYAGGDTDALLGESRRWDGERTALGPLSRVVVDASVSGARDTGLPAHDLESLLDERHVAVLVRSAHAAARALSDEPEEIRIGAGIIAARDLVDRGAPDAHAELSLLAGGWTGACGDAEGALACFRDVRAPRGLRLALAIDAEIAYFLWDIGQSLGYELAVATLSARRDAFGDRDPDTLTSRANVAAMMGDRGEHAAARDELREVAHIQAHVLGAEHRETLGTRCEVAFEAGELGEHGAAHAECAEVAHIQSRALGPEHPLTLAIRDAAAFYLAELGDYETARAEHVELVRLRTRVLGAGHPDTLSSMHNAAYCVGWLGEYDTARTGFAEVARARAETLGAEHPDTLLSRYWAAVCAASLGEHQVARDESLQVAEVETRVLGPGHPSTLHSLHNAAEAASEAGAHQVARAEFAAVAESRARVLGPEHADTLTSRHYAANACDHLGDSAVARLEHLEIAQIRARVLGPEDPDTLLSRYLAASCAGEVGEHVVAREELLMVADSEARTLGPEHPDTLITRDDAAYQAGEAGEHLVARREFLAVAEARARILGPEHQDTLASYAHAARQAGETGEHQLARDELRSLADIQARVFGAGDSRTLRSRALAAQELGRCGHAAAAISELSDIIGATPEGEAETLRTARSALAPALRSIRTREHATWALAALSEHDGMAWVMLVDSVRDGFGDASSLAAWLMLWSDTLAASPEFDPLSRLFSAAAELLDGQPGAALTLPEEERRLAYLIAERQHAVSS